MRLLILVLACAISFGCRGKAEPDLPSAPASRTRAAVKLTILVVDDAEMAAGISLLAGEWNERSGGELVVEELSLSQLLEAEQVGADLVVYPSRQLGTLAMRNWLRPVRQSVLEDPALAWGDLLSVLRDQSARYGGQVFALPFGEMPLVMAYSGSVPPNLPNTWEELGLHCVRAKETHLHTYPLTAELLARALAKAAPLDRASILFDTHTLDAQLNHPPLVESLEEMRKSSTPSDFSAQVCLPRDPEEGQLSALLGSTRVYNRGLEQWEAVEIIAPPVICGFSGRLVSVTASSRNASSAFKLLPWLVSGAIGAELSQRSSHTLWYRPSQVPKAPKWLGDMPEGQQPRLFTEMLSHGEAYLLPRIPGIDRYLAEMESAIAKVVENQSSAAKALAALEFRWDSLTDELGREQQQEAFRKHLGLGD